MFFQKAYIPYGGYWSTPFCRWQGSLANEHGIHLLTNYETSWYGSNHRAYQMVQDSAIGPLRKIVVHDGHPGPAGLRRGRQLHPPALWQNGLAGVSGDITVLCLWLAGEPGYGGRRADHRARRMLA